MLHGVYESSVQRWMVGRLMSGVLEGVSKETIVAWEFSWKYWENHEAPWHRVLAESRIGKFFNTSPDRYRTQACGVMDPKWRVRAWKGLISVVMVTKPSGGGRGGRGCWRSGDCFSSNVANFNKQVLSATQELQLHEVEWQNGIDDKRRTAVEVVCGGMI